MRAQEAARSALDAGMDRVAGLPPGPGWDSVRIVLDEVLGDGLERRATFRRLSSEFFFLEGEGWSRGWPGVRQVGAAGWRLDPLTRVRAFRGGVEVGGTVSISVGGGVSSSRVLEAPTGWDAEVCRVHEALLDSIPGLGLLPATAGLVPPGSGSPEPPGLGLLNGPDLMALEETPGGLERLEGEGRAGCPGLAEPVLILEDGPLTLRDGQLCGLLVVAGDLLLEGEGLFQGLLLVGGDVTIGNGWRVEGMGRIGGALQVGSGGSLDVMACPVVRALTRIPAVQITFPVPGARNLTLY